MFHSTSNNSLDEMTSLQDHEVTGAQWQSWPDSTSKQTDKNLDLKQSSDSPTSTISMNASQFNTFNDPSLEDNDNDIDYMNENSFSDLNFSNPEGSDNNEDKENLREKKVDDAQLIFLDPPYCFCQKPAFKIITKEFGVIYECHFMSQNVSSPSKPILNKIYQKSDSIHSHICSFHIHYDAWSNISRQIHNHTPIDPMNPELSTCPFFNFTFCVAFRMTNDFKKLSPPVPKCFCNLRVVISENDFKGKRRISFTCPNFYIDGAKPKCSWFLWAEELVFNKPKYPRHSLQMAQEIHSQIQEKNKQCNIMDNNNNTMELEPRTMIFSNENDNYHSDYATNNNNDISNHHHDHMFELKSPLSDNEKFATVTPSNEIEFQYFNILSNVTKGQELNNDVIPTTSMHNNIRSNNSGASDPDIYSNSSNSLNHHHQPSLYKSIATRPTTNCSSTILKLNKGFLPTSTKQESTLISGSGSNDSAINNNNKNSNNLSTIFGQLTLEQPYNYNLPTTTQYTTNDNNTNTAFNSNNYNNNYNNSDLMKIWEKIHYQDNKILQLEEKQKELQNVRTIYINERNDIKSKLENEMNLRLRCQKELIDARLDNEQLSQDVIFLNNQLQQVKQKNASINLKCQLCYNAEVQCALVPCYHCIYCIDCAYKLNDCAICRKPVQSIQKIFLG